MPWPHLQTEDLALSSRVVPPRAWLGHGEVAAKHPVSPLHACRDYEAQLLRFAVRRPQGQARLEAPAPPCPGWALPGKGGCWRGLWPQALPEAVSASPPVIPGEVPGAGACAAEFSSALFPDSFRAVTVAGLPAPDEPLCALCLQCCPGPCLRSEPVRPPWSLLLGRAFSRGGAPPGGSWAFAGWVYLLLHQAFPAEATCTMLVPLRSARLTAVGSP